MQTYNDDVNTDMQNVVSLISMKDKVLNVCVSVCVFCLLVFEFKNQWIYHVVVV